MGNKNKDPFEKGFVSFWFLGKQNIERPRLYYQNGKKEGKIKENKNTLIFGFVSLIGIAARNVVFIINNALRLSQEALQTCERILQ
jgi:hypothetical protein